MASKSPALVLRCHQRRGAADGSEAGGPGTAAVTKSTP